MRINLANGAIITSFIPVWVNVLLMATIIEIIRMVGSSSEIAKTKLEKILIIDFVNEPLDTMAMRKMPMIHSIVVSNLLTIKPIISKINAK